MRVVNCTYDYYHKHGKWPSTGDLTANYLGVRSNRYTGKQLYLVVVLAK